MGLYYMRAVLGIASTAGHAFCLTPSEHQTSLLRPAQQARPPIISFYLASVALGLHLRNPHICFTQGLCSTTSPGRVFRL